MKPLQSRCHPADKVNVRLAESSLSRCVEDGRGGGQEEAELYSPGDVSKVIAGPPAVGYYFTHKGELPKRTETVLTGYRVLY